MEKRDKYTVLTVEPYPYGWDIRYFYLPAGSNLAIGDVIRGKNGKQYRIVDGKHQVDLVDIDRNRYRLFE
jgi:hypothetical protein